MIQISETAARKIRTLMAKHGIDEGGLRVGVKGGGCSGLSYTFAWERQPRLGDEVYEGSDGAKIFVDRKSLIYLDGTVLDYDTGLISKGFVFNNPNQTSACGLTRSKRSRSRTSWEPMSSQRTSMSGRRRSNSCSSRVS